MSFSILHTYLNSPSQAKIRYVYLTLESSGTEQINSVIVRGAKTWLTSNTKNVVVPSLGLEYAWSKVMEAEFALASFLKRNSLFTLPMEKEVLHFKGCRFDAYSYPSFQRLQLEGKYLLDLRQDKNSSWKIQGHSLFPATVDKLNEGTWRPVFEPFLEDIAKLIVLNLPLNPKYHCLAIVKADKGYVVRYLAQDMAIDPKQIRQIIAEPNPLVWNELLRKNLESILLAVLSCEFKTFGLNGSQKELLNKLVSRFIPLVLEKAKNLHHQRCLRFDYERYKTLAKTDAVFTVKYNSVTHSVTVVKYLDQGADKKLLLLSNGQILFIPNLQCFDPIRDAEEIGRDEVPPTVANWKKIVDEEAKFAAKAAQLNLLTSQVKPCQLIVDGYIIESYLADSFENKAHHGIHVVENGFKTCSWLKENLFLFKTDEERMNMANWEPRIELLVKDVIKVCAHRLPINTDALHSALYMHNGSYQIRYFGFDFQNPKLATAEYACYIFETILEPIVRLEFRNTPHNIHRFTMDLTEICMNKFRSQTGLLPVQSEGM